MNMEDITKVVERKIWTADQLLLQLGEIKKKSESLSSEERMRIPGFSDDWSEEGVTKYVKEVGKAVEDPIKYKNKVRLEGIGVKTERISDDILGDTFGIDEILRLFQKLKNINENINEILIAEVLLASWLKEGTDNTKEKLEGIVTAKPAFKRVLESGADKKLKSELVRRSIIDVTFLSKAEDAITKFANLRDYEVVLDYDGDFERLYQNLGEAWAKIQQIQQTYGISEAEIKNLINGKALLDAAELLANMDKEYAERKRKLLEEWNMYASTLKSFGEEVLEPPESLQELGKAIEDLRNRCLEYLGGSGLKLLKFLKGEDEFPTNVGIEEIRKALESLRPFFLKALREER
ncbi:MAG: hypothetical protein DDT30_01281 [Dehalococcoidia bacterium]|uniref:Uncharacterized protein n=1 Tax=Psychracetigena formicireducens TaxID=2986056 RepID=A0A9E2F4W6_PSYF1|nr:hypothetical protein [Bacillota bacterium]MBT9145526.1 hypothetical protein [Candidatus Psychracetigena formicireducens]